MRLRGVWCGAFAACLLSGCVSDGDSIGNSIIQSTIFAQPAVVYHSGDNLQVSYYRGGLQQAFNEKNAVELRNKECAGAFKITRRSDSKGGETYIDAVCVH